MKGLPLIVVLILSACGGSLTKEQREAMMEGKKAHEIKRITEADFHEKVIALGSGILLNQGRSDSSQVDIPYSLRWVTLQPGMPEGVEQLLAESYSSSRQGGDNVQKKGEDSLLFTRPVFEGTAPDSVRFRGMWLVGFSKRDLALSM